MLLPFRMLLNGYAVAALALVLVMIVMLAEPVHGRMTRGATRQATWLTRTLVCQ
jgi:hypothetical protein